MSHQMKSERQAGVNISLDIPAREPELFKNKSTNDVLLLLCRHRLDAFSLSEIAKQTGNTPPTVKRAVDVLEKNDLVVQESSGTQRSVRINRERLSVPDDPILQIPQAEFHIPVKTAVEELEKAIENPIGILLYGSVARGEADRRSDIDIWVLVSEDRAAGQRAANEVALELEERQFDSGRYAYDIDVEDASSIPMYTSDIREIVLSGIPLYKTTQFETVERLLMNEVENRE